MNYCEKEEMLDIRSENSSLKKENKKLREALEEVSKALETVEPVVDHQMSVISEFEDFASSVGQGYVSKEQRDWNELVYDAYDIISDNPAKKVLKELDE